jgi:ribonucleoside-diphosphate reductase alpha chain
MAADRGAYICQSQSLNIHIQDVNFGKLTSMHFHAWKLGLKTGMYYLRTKAATDAIKFTVEKQAEPAIEQTNLVNETEMQYSEAAAKAAAASFDGGDDQNKADMTCSLDNPEACEACGS